MWPQINKHRRVINLLLGAAAILIVLSPLAYAQAKAPSAILNQYRGQRTNWFTAVWPVANTLDQLVVFAEAGDATGTYTVTVNGSATALKCTLNHARSCHDLADSAAIVAGQAFAIHATAISGRARVIQFRVRVH